MRSLFVFSLAVFLAGCSILPEPKQAPQVISLNVHLTPQVSQAPIRDGLWIDRPTAESDLDRRDIRVHHSNQTYGIVDQVIWSDNLPDLLHHQVALAFQREGTFINITQRPRDIQTRFRLVIDLLTFEVEQHETQAITHIAWLAKLIDQTKYDVIAFQEFHQTSAPFSGGAQGLSKAFQTTFSTPLTLMLQWAKQTIKRYKLANG